jgi:DNA primase
MAYYGEEIIEQVREATDIVDVIQEFLPLKRKGRNYWARCPFHQEKTPSFSVSPDKQIFHCFGCQKGGNVFTFIMEHEKLPFPETLKYLANRANIQLPEVGFRRESKELERLYYAHEVAAAFFYEHLKESRSTLEYLRKRRLSDETITRFRLGYAPDSWESFIAHAHSKDLKDEDLIKSGLVVQKDDGGIYDRFRNRLTFTIFNTVQKPIAFGARALSKEETAKYLNSPETQLYSKARILYGLSHSRTEIRKAEESIVVEGYFDFLSLYQVGIANVVASSGTAFTREQAQLLARSAAGVTLMFDSDSAGQQAAIRSVDHLFAAGLDVKVVLLPKGEDPDSLARKGGVEAVREQLALAKSYVEFSLGTLPDSYENLSLALKNKAIKRLTDLAFKIDDPIKRELFIQEISKWYQIEESVLKQSLKPTASRKPPARPESEKPKTPALEEDMLGLLLAQPGLLDSVAEKLGPTDFTDSDTADIYALLILMHQEGDGLVVAELIDRLEGESQKRKVAALATQDIEVDDPAALLNDYLRAFQRRRQKERLQQLKEGYELAQREGDKEKADYYWNEINKLQTKEHH